MILGMSLPAFTTLHVIISLLGIASGLVVAAGLISNNRLPAWTALFLASTVLTSATGFLFHAIAFGPPHVVGVISLLVLAAAIVALYARHLARAWRAAYIISALLALYLNLFVAVVQAFQKIPALHQFAPQGSEPPFAAAQLALLLVFVLLVYRSLKKFSPAAGATVTGMT